MTAESLPERPAIEGRVVLVGNFGGDRPGLDGQILRTRLVARELEKRLGPDRVIRVDTHRLPRHPLATLSAIRSAFAASKVAVIMPAERGLRHLLPFYLYWRRRFGTRLHYLVIGGWLPDFLIRHPGLLRGIGECDGVHVQSRRMIARLEAMGLVNLAWLPNFRDFPRQVRVFERMRQPLSLVFLSRMIPEKGAALAVRAVEELNAEAGHERFTLDLYGPVARSHREWLDTLLADVSPAIRFLGPLAPEQAIARLAGHDALLFPTCYAGEGFPGVIVEAYAAGIPVVASDWQDNREVVDEGRTGLLFPVGDIAALKDCLDWLTTHPEALQRMKHQASEAAGDYHVDNVMPGLLAALGLAGDDVRRISGGHA